MGTVSLFFERAPSALLFIYLGITLLLVGDIDTVSLSPQAVCCFTLATNQSINEWVALSKSENRSLSSFKILQHTMHFWTGSFPIKQRAINSPQCSGTRLHELID
jgi:hypothetical protein